MMVHEVLSRRSFLGYAAITLAAGPVSAVDKPSQYSISALIEGDGMVRIPAGEFLMGSAHGNADEDPVHRVRISLDFEMGKFEVTQAQWEAVMTDAHAKPDAKLVNPQGAVVSRTPSHFQGRFQPVENVSWDDIALFLFRLNTRDPKHTYRLPTEAEWEYACKAGRPEENAASLDARAWYKGNSGNRPQQAGLKQPNAWGLYDMLGNVAEWVHDWYGPNYYEESPAARPGRTENRILPDFSGRRLDGRGQVLPGGAPRIRFSGEPHGWRRLSRGKGRQTLNSATNRQVKSGDGRFTPRRGVE